MKSGKPWKTAQCMVGVLVLTFAEVSPFHATIDEFSENGGFPRNA